MKTKYFMPAWRYECITSYVIDCMHICHLSNRYKAGCSSVVLRVSRHGCGEGDSFAAKASTRSAITRQSAHQKPKGREKRLAQIANKNSPCLWSKNNGNSCIHADPNTAVLTLYLVELLSIFPARLLYLLTAIRIFSSHYIRFIDLGLVLEVKEVCPDEQDKNCSTFLVHCEGRTYQLQAIDQMTMKK